MKTVYIIRHAESISNIGERTDSHNTIPLSEKGKEQARELAETIDLNPDLVVVSPFLRTQETALPFLEKYKHVPVETWNVEEFTYLDPKVCNGTTREDRLPLVTAYWDRLDIHYRDSDESESFFMFISRIQEFIESLRKREEKSIVVFSHGAFIQNLLSLKKYNGNSSYVTLSNDAIETLMKEYKETVISGNNPIKNVSINQFTI